MIFSKRCGKLDLWRLTIRRDDARLNGLTTEESRRLRGAQLHAILSLAPAMAIANFVDLLVVAILFHHRGHDVFLGSWGIALGAAMAPWLANWRAQSRRPPRLEASVRAVRRVTCNAMILGALSAAPVVWLFDGATQPERLILASLVVGMAGGGPLALAPVWQAALAFTLALVSTLIGVGGPVCLFLAATTASFAFVIARAAHQQADLLIDRHFADSRVRAQGEIIGLLLKDFEEGASDFLWETDARGRLSGVSPRLAQLVGQPEQRLEGRDFAELIRELNEAAPRDASALAELLRSKEPFRDRLVALTIDGRRRQWSMNGKPAFGPRGEFRGFRGVGCDVTDAERLANYDSLTGLPNRSMFERQAEQAIARLTRAEQPFAVMTLDLDRFKRVNDTLGHAVGDALLAAAAKRISECLDENDLVTRFGGDEFVILHEGAALGKIQALCRRLIEEFSRPFEIGDFQVLVGASIGIALAPNDGEAFDTLLRNSDLALYRAKADGRGIHRFFESSLDEGMQGRRQLEADLREALGAGQLSLVYQPLVDTRTGAITACEALVRWRHPVRGDLSPAEFIPLAEETGLVSLLGEWALEEACREAARWPRDLRVAVNVSPIQFRMGGLVGAIERALTRSALAPERLEVEVTESIFIENKVETRATLAAIHRLGVGISLDDFGTGYSSLSYLCSFAFDRVKIDRSFVQGIDGDADSAAVVRTIAALAAALDVRMTAEGVETAGQLNRLASFGCDEAQGYLFSQPLTARDVGLLLEANGQGAESSRAATAAPPRLALAG